MEQLIRKGYPADSTGRMIEVAMIFKKIHLDLSREQLMALGKITRAYLTNLQFQCLDDKAAFYLLWGLHDKLEKKAMSLKQSIKLTLDMPLAWAVNWMLEETDLSMWPYEASLQQFLIYEIDRQTA